MQADRLFGRAGLTFCLTVTLLAVIHPADARADEYRAMWVDAWGAGMHSQSEVDTLLGVPGNGSSLGRLRQANCNAVVVQVRRRFDTCYPSGVGEPYMTGLSPWNFNALQAMINAAHDTTGGKKRIEVHCWMVAFATDGGAVWQQHNNPADPENYWATRDSNGNHTNDEAFDPGHPKCLEYITNAAMDIVTRFDVDGIHWDYIRFTANNQGYNPTSVARYNERYGLSGQPSSSSEQFKQWRRDQVTSLVRRTYAKMLAVKPQMKHSGSFVTWNPSPSSSTRAAFMATRPYYDVYSDWDSWMQEGIIDVAFPMTYYNWASLPNDYVRWMNWEKDRHGNRHMVIGPGIYMNSLSNALLVLEKTREPSPAGNYADGFCGYSYRVPYASGSWTGFSPSLVSQVTPTWEDIPDAPWKSNPTTGHISGTVTYYDSGDWADHSVVSITGPENRNMYVDGTGFYAFIDLPPGNYTVTASKAGYANAVATANVQIGEVTGNMYIRDLQLGSDLPPQIYNVHAVNITPDSATIAWNTNAEANSQVEYGLTTSYGNLTPVDPAEVTSHSVDISGLTGNTVYHFRVISTNAQGTTTSPDQTFTTSGPPQVFDAQVVGIGTNEATVTWTTNAPATGQVLYGLTQAYGSQTALVSNDLTAHSITITGLTPSTTYHCQAISTNPYGNDASADLTFTTLEPPTEMVIDNSDPGFSGRGSWSLGSYPGVPKIGDNYLYTSGTGNIDEASITSSGKWTPNIPAEGFYDVYVYYQIGSNRTTGARYKVVHADGQEISVQNQYSEEGGLGGWFLVGENLRFAAGTGGYVELGNNTPDSALVSADAAKFVYKGMDLTPPTIPLVVDEGDYTSNWNTLQANWSSLDDETGIAKYEYRIVQVGGPVLRDWTDAGLETSVVATDLPLLLGPTYVFEVRATNGAAMVSEVGVSDGIRVFTFDANNDGMINGVDMGAFLTCLTAESVPYPADPGLECGRFDTNADGDVDVEDYGKFQICLTGNGAANPACID